MLRLIIKIDSQTYLNLQLVMIQLRKALIAHCSSFNLPRIFFFSSKGKTTLSDIAQQAAWASGIITLIKGININEDDQAKFNGKSLRSVIDQFKISSEQFSFKKENQDIVKDMFRQGIQLREQFANQNRIMAGKNQSNSKFVFNPNYSVTRQIFQCLARQTSSYFISGGYGISKTISLALYQHLSPYIHKLIFQSQTDPDIKKDLIALLRASLIVRYPKCWYWNIFETNQSNHSYFKELVLEQMSQLPQATKEELKMIQSEQRAANKIKRIYLNAGILPMIMIDQVNLAAANIRTWNNIIDKWNNEIEPLKSQYKTASSQYQHLIQNAKDSKQFNMWSQEKQKRLKELKIQRYQNEKLMRQQKKANQDRCWKEANIMIDKIERFRKFGILQILASSMNFQREILKKVIQPEKLSLNFYKSSKQAKQYQINFAKSIKSQQGRVDFLDFFLFQLQRKLSNYLTDKSSIFKQVEKKFLQIAATKTLKGYYRLIFIRQYINQKIKQIKFIRSQNQNQKAVEKASQKPKCIVLSIPLQANKEQISQIQFLTDDKQKIDIFQSFDKFCHKNSVQKLKTFLSKDPNGEKQKIMKILLNIAKLGMKFNYETLSFRPQMYTSVLGCRPEQIFLDNNYNKQLVPVEYNDNVIILQWTPQQFIDLAQNLLQAKQEQFFQEFVSGYLKNYTSKKQARGGIFQYAVMQLLNPETLIKFQLLKENGYTQSENFMIKQRGQFYSFQNPQENQKKKQNKKQKQQQKEKKNKHENENEDKSKDQKQEKLDTNKKVQNQKKKVRNHRIQRNFYHILELAQKNPGYAIAAQPISQKKKVDQTSPTIDFAIVRYNLDKNFDIFTFDVATTDNVKGVDNKLKKAKALFTDLTKNSFDQKKYRVQHIILCKKQFCLKKFIYVDKFSITCSPYQQLDVIGYPQEKMHAYLFFSIYRRQLKYNPSKYEEVYGEEELEQEKN